MTHEAVSSSLTQEIEKLKADLAQAYPDAASLFETHIEALARSGIAEHGLKQGARAPDFALLSATGKLVALSNLLHQGPVVLTFYRGEWCPYCNLQLRAYQKALPAIEEWGATLVAVSPQTPDSSLTTVQKKELTFPVLSDPHNMVARQYGLVFSLPEALRPLYQQSGSDLSVFNGDASWELPMAGTFVIDQSGRVRLAFVNADYTHRLEPAVILETLRSLAK